MVARLFWEQKVMCSNHIFPKCKSERNMHLVHYYFILVFFISCFMVYFSLNPVHSVLFLILAFLNSAFILLLFKIEFLALLFIIIYVGAIAILFLFIVMMLNIKKELFNLKINNFFLVFLVSCFFLIFLSFDFVSFELGNVFQFQFSFLTFLLDGFGDITMFGQSLYNYYLVLVLISGFILLVAMIGAIVLTLEFQSVYLLENSFRQLSRTTKTVKLFY